MFELTATLLVPRGIAQPEAGHAVLDLFLKHFPRHVPQRCGDLEPLKEHFDVNDLTASLRSWGGFNFIATRSAPSLVMQVLFGPPKARVPRHSTISLIRLQTDRPEEVERTWEFLHAVADVFTVDYAVAHVLTRSELEDRLAAIRPRPAVWPQPSGEHTVNRLRGRIERDGFHAVLFPMRLKHFTVHLKKCLPELSWVSMFGPPYVQMFGRERLLSAPAHQVSELASGAIALKLTESLNDSEDDWGRFKSIRDRCQAHLGVDAFCDPGKPSGHAYRTPQFVFPSDRFA